MNNDFYDDPPGSERDADDRYADAHAGDPVTVGGTQAALDLGQFIWDFGTSMNRAIAAQLQCERSER